MNHLGENRRDCRRSRIFFESPRSNVEFHFNFIATAETFDFGPSYLNFATKKRHFATLFAKMRLAWYSRSVTCAADSCHEADYKYERLYHHCFLFRNCRRSSGTPLFERVGLMETTRRFRNEAYQQARYSIHFCLILIDIIDCFSN